MQEFTGKVAVITGAASGFGRELAILCAGEGMRLSLADVDEAGLAGTQALVASSGVDTLLVRCDVSQSEAVEQLAVKTYERFGAAHLLFNNAGVAALGPTWTSTLEDWQWVLGVNLMGVVHGIRSFVPRMLAQGDECHIVNTSSVAGFLSVPGSSPYCVSKHGVVTLSECLYHELKPQKAKIGVSVLCPAFVKTGIGDSGRNRPAELSSANPLSPHFDKRMKKAIEAGNLTAEDIAKLTMDAIKADRFYILTHPSIKPSIEERMRGILEEKSPSNPMP
jgi:NAD(P)-dependent dehydrogenase (short-subunit alcohol dehydrogenase family)